MNPSPTSPGNPAGGAALRWAVLAATLLAALLSLHWRATGFWGFDPGATPFLDTRIITAGWKTLRAGGDPLVANPWDPLGRPFNYPRLWMLPARFGLGPDSTAACGFALWAVWLAAVLGLLRRCRPTAVLALLPLLLGPAVMLAMSRGNIDLAIWALVFAAAVLYGVRSSAGAVAVFAAFALKLYPGVLAVYWAGRKRDRKIAVVLFGAMAAYLWLTRRDLALIQASTIAIQSFLLSFGRTCPAQLLARWPAWAAYARAAEALVLIAPCLLAWSGRLPRLPAIGGGSAARLFATGAAVYCACFVLGANYNYRLVFLLFCVPLLFEPAAFGSRAWRGLLYGLILASHWGMAAIAASNALGGNATCAYLAVNAVEWVLFAVLAAVLLSAAFSVFSSEPGAPS